MRLQAALVGDLEKIMAQEVEDIRTAGDVTGAGQESARLKQDFRNQITGAGLSQRLANTVRSDMYPRQGKSAGAAGHVYVKPSRKGGGAGSAVDIIGNLDAGTVIKPKDGKRFLAIPTGYNRAGGRRAGKPLISTEEMARNKKLTFVLPSGSGVKLWCIRVSEAATLGKNGRVKRLAFAGGNAFANLRRLGSGRGKRVGAILKEGFVPMFTLVPSVTLRKRFDLSRDAVAAIDRLPGTILGKFPERNG